MSADRFHCRIPEGLWYDPEYDMWVRFEGDEAVIGATALGIHLAGEVIAFTAKPRGAEVARGRSLGTIECAKTVLAVHAPIGFVLDLGNEALEARPSQLNRDPYEAWMARGRPFAWDEDRRHLIDAEAYRAHVRRCAPEADIAT